MLKFYNLLYFKVMNLCIDIGNSKVKVAVFAGPEIIYRNQWSAMGPGKILDIAAEFPDIKDVIICSVRPQQTELVGNLKKYFPNIIVFNEFTAIPVVNLYETRDTLGKDRLAAVAGANNNYPGRNVLVIDAGTAITYDIIDENAQYLGGNISPGLSMRFRALHDYTGKLPLVKPGSKVPALGKRTEDAIAAGVQNGIIFEMDSYIELFKKDFSDLVIILTGGDANYFDKKLKSTIFVDSNLIFTGLNRILTYNVKEN